MLGIAAGLITALQRREVAEIFAYGSSERVLIFARSTPVAAGAALDCTALVGAFPFVDESPADLFAPELTLVVDPVGPRPLAGLVAPELLAEGARSRSYEQQPLTCALELDTTPDEALPGLARACRWARGTDRRLTLARRLALPAVDPVATFARMTPIHRQRAFLRLGSRSYVGCSPELLLDGTREQLTSYKLSGTAPPNPEDPAQMERDTRLIHEHEGSIASAAAALEAVGVVRRGPREIVRLAELWHFETALHCTPHPEVTVSDCIAAVRPSGAHPRREGLALRAELEDAPRGLYYGLAGHVLADGRACFSQLIRTLFRDEHGWYTQVGAAVTAHSTPQLELAETRLKLASIRFVRSCARR